VKLIKPLVESISNCAASSKKVRISPKSASEAFTSNINKLPTCMLELTAAVSNTGALFVGAAVTFKVNGWLVQLLGNPESSQTVIFADITSTTPGVKLIKPLVESISNCAASSKKVRISPKSASEAFTSNINKLPTCMLELTGRCVKYRWSV